MTPIISDTIRPMGIYTRRLLSLLVMIVALFVVGTAGYMLIEGWNVLDAAYMAVITLGSVGYGEVHPLSETGRTFTIIYIFLGVGTLAFIFSRLIELILEAELSGILQRRRMEKRIDQLNNHVIVCGYGRVGRSAVGVLADADREIVIIDTNKDVCERLQHDGMLVFEGDATRDEMLMRAGIDRAWGLIATAGEDALNLFIVLSARTLNPDLHIVARSARPENDAKLIRAGANRVVSPYHIGGQRMAQSLLNPQLTEFLDVLRLDNGVELWMEEVEVGKGCDLVGKTIVESNMRQKTGVTLLAIVNGSEVITPSATTRFNQGDNLIVIGTREQLKALQELVQ